MIYTLIIVTTYFARWYFYTLCTDYIQTHSYECMYEYQISHQFILAINFYKFQYYWQVPVYELKFIYLATVLQNRIRIFSKQSVLSNYKYHAKFSHYIKVINFAFIVDLYPYTIKVKQLHLVNLLLLLLLLLVMDIHTG